MLVACIKLIKNRLVMGFVWEKVHLQEPIIMQVAILQEQNIIPIGVCYNNY
jgi:hypothetical protein